MIFSKYIQNHYRGKYPQYKRIFSTLLFDDDRNKDIKICRNCKYYMIDERKCSKLWKTNIITGEKSFEMAIQMRYNPNECGKEGKYFEENKYRVFTESYHYLRNNKHNIYTTILCSFAITIFAMSFTGRHKV